MVEQWPFKPNVLDSNSNKFNLAYMAKTVAAVDLKFVPYKRVSVQVRF